LHIFWCCVVFLSLHVFITFLHTILRLRLVAPPWLPVAFASFVLYFTAFL
jgi:hypothetical protein